MRKGGMDGNNGSSSGKGARGGRMRTFLTLVLIILIGVNTYETFRLRAEVSALERRERRGTAASPSADVSTEPTLGAYVPQGAALLDEARRHAQQAEASLHLKDYERARSEAADGVRSFEKANAAARADGDRILVELRTAAKVLQSRTSDSNSRSSTTPAPAKDHTGTGAHAE